MRKLLCVLIVCCLMFGTAYAAELNAPGTLPISSETIHFTIGVPNLATVEDWETNEQTLKLEKDLTTHNMTVEQYFKHMPLPEEAMRRDFREVLLVQKFLKRDVEEKISLTTEEIESSMKALRSRAFLKETLGEKAPKVARKKVTDMLRATRLNKGYQDMLRSLCAKAEIGVPDYPEIADVERYVIPWCPRSRQQALPEGVAPERAVK